MKEQRVILEPFELLKVLQCTGMVRENEHGYMIVSGYIQQDKEEEYCQLLAQNTWANVRIFDEHGNNEILFTGIVTEGEISVINGLKTLQVKIHTGTYLMDLKRHTRSFQSSNCTYNEIMSSFADSYKQYKYIMCSGNEKGTNRFLCQYQETDWQFAKRVASCGGTVLYSNYIGSGIKFYFGRPLGVNRGKISLTEYSVKQSGSEIMYEGKMRELFEIGDIVEFEGKNLHIARRYTEFAKGELYHIYTLTEYNAGNIRKEYNDKLIGVSLDAVVEKVDKTSVMVSIQKDENKKSGARWFPFATVYSSPDGTGWYCMPEIGDSVRLYFPSNKEEEAYVFSAAHLSSGDSVYRVNPENKSIMNKQGKEILLKPDAILITNNKGMSIELSDTSGISIISDKTITLESQEAIEITSVTANIDMVSPKKISLKQGDTSVELSDKMVMHGTKIRLE